MLGAAVAVGAILIGSALADSGRPDDCVDLYAIFRGSDGVAVKPTSATLFVFKDGAAIDSSHTMPDSVTFYHRIMRWKYRIPASDADSSAYSFFVRASDGTIIDDYIPCVPSTIMLRDALLDSLPGSAVADLWSQVESARQAVIDSTDCTPCGAYDLLGNPISDARVYLTRTASMLDIRTQVMSDVGNYYIIAPLDPVNPDTFYVSIWRQGSRQSGYTMVTRP